MPASIRINGVVGSDESAVDFDGVTNVTLDSNPAATTYQWEFLDWPLDSSFDQTWLTGVWGAANPTVVFTPDREGTWVVKLTDTNDSTTDIIIVGVRSRKTNLRIPGATETTETDNINYAGATNHRGWALERNKSLRNMNDLLTAGGVQICYLDDTAVGGGINAGMLVSLELNGGQVIDPTTSELVPTVKLSTATFASDEYRYYGVVKAGRVGVAANPGANQFEYDTTNIQNQTFIQVSRGGHVTGGAAGTLDLSTTTRGEILYASATAGVATTDADRFASNPPEIMVPVGYVVDNTNPGTMAVMPNMAYTGPASQQELKFLGIGDFSVLRIGNVPTAGYTSLANEEAPAIEVVGINREAAQINQGEVVCINSNGVYLADSSLDSSVSANRQDGIIGVAVENVAAGSVGHYTIYGRVPNAVTTGAAAGSVLYVGSSTATTGDLSGQAVRSTLIQTEDFMNFGNEAVPIGIWDGNELIMGVVPDDGIIGTVESDRTQSNGDFGKSTNQANNSNALHINNSNVYKPSSVAYVDLPNTRSENQPTALAMFEAVIKGEDLYDTRDNVFGGVSYSGGMDVPGAGMFNGTWNPTGGGAPSARGYYGTFEFDDRLQEDLIPTKIVVTGYTDDAAAGNLTLELEGRQNRCNATTGGPFDFSTSKSEPLNNTSTNSVVTFEFDLADDASGEKYYLLKPSGANEVETLDILLSRADATAAGLIVTKVVLQGIVLNRYEENLETLFEYKRPGYALVDAASTNFNVVNDQGTVGTNDTIGAKMSEAYGVGQTSELAGFFPIDNRFDDSTDLDIYIIGKYQGDAGGAQSIDIDITYRLEYCNTEYTNDVAVGGTALPTISISPAGASNPNYETLCFTGTLSAPFTTSNLAGIRYRIERSGTNPLSNGTGEVFFQVSNVMFVQADTSTAIRYPEVFEQKSELCNSYDNDARAFNLESNGDYNGFLFSSGGSEELYYFVDFDRRYDFRQDLEITISGWVEAAASEITLAVSIDPWNYDSTPIADGSYNRFVSDTVDASAYAANNRVTCHNFRIPANAIWPNLTPNWFDLNESFNNGVMLKLTRTDGSLIDYTATSIHVRTSAGNLTTKNTTVHDISEEYTAYPNTYLTELFSQRESVDSSFTASVNRMQFVFGADGDTTIAAAGNTTLTPVGFMGGSVTGGGRNVGHFMPYSFAITHVHGMAIDADGTRSTALTGSTLTFSLIYADGSGLVSSNSVLNFSHQVTFRNEGGGVGNNTGTIRWNGTGMNFIGGDPTQLPIAYLNEDYRTTAPGWVLECVFTNNGGASIDLLANIIVEVNLIPATLGTLNG